MGSSGAEKINWIGIPFKWNGKSFKGVDCAGLVRLFLRKEMGIKLPPDFGVHSPQAWVKYSEERILGFLNEYAIRIEYPRFGDIVALHVWERAAHVGVIIDNDQFLNIMYNQTSTISRVSSFGKHRLLGYWRVKK